MSDLIKSYLKEVSKNLNVIQMKNKELILSVDNQQKYKLLEQMNLCLLKIKQNFNLIDQEMELSSGKVRLEFKGAIENNRIEYRKIVKEIEKLNSEYKSDNINNNLNNDNNNPNMIINKIQNNTNNLLSSNKTANEIIERDKASVLELKKQRNQLNNIHESMMDTEKNLTIVQQITAVMKRNDLFYKLKLYILIVLLFIADLIILYIKLKK